MPDIDPDVTLRMAKAIADMYGDAAGQLLTTVARRLAKGITEPGWAEQKLAELTGLRAEAAAVVARLTEDAPGLIETTIAEANSIGANAARISTTLAPVTNQAAVQALAAETVGVITGTHQTIIRTTLDTYRSVIAEVAAPGVVTGAETRLQATQRALNRFADHGITGFRDRAGRNWEIESYAEMATRTATGRAMVDGRVTQYQADGRNLVIVSNAPQECEKCRPFEGQLLSLNGEQVGDIIDTRQGRFKVLATLAQARSAGLQHVNCRHDLRPFIPGLTKPMTHTEDPEGDQARQEQRRLERGVRQWKRRAAVALDEQTERAAKAKAKAWSQRLKEHVEANDLKRLRYREQISSAR